MDSPVAVWASKRSSRFFVLALVASVWALFGAGNAFASHFRYAHLTWAPAASPANTVNFRLQVAWRRGFPFVGPSVNPTTLGASHAPARAASPEWETSSKTTPG